MRSISDKAFEFLKNEYENHVQEFLDDPLAISVDAEDAAEHYQNLVLIGLDTGKPFWNLAKKVGSKHELDRLVRLLLEGGATNLPKSIKKLAV